MPHKTSSHSSPKLIYLQWIFMEVFTLLNLWQFHICTSVTLLWGTCSRQRKVKTCCNIKTLLSHNVGKKLIFDICTNAKTCWFCVWLLINEQKQVPAKRQAGHTQQKLKAAWIQPLSVVFNVFTLWLHPQIQTACRGLYFNNKWAQLKSCHPILPLV